MTKNNVEPAIQPLPEIRPEMAEKKVRNGGDHKEPGDLINNLNTAQSKNAASIVAALVCLSVGFGSGDL